jgi:tripartite-type tricarboxylate transporter receptor subunit TctC
MQRRTLIQTAIAGLAASALPTFAQGTWPTGKAITYLVPFPAGGTTDVMGRLISQKLGAVLGTSVVIDNRGGAGGSVGSEIASRAAPDGYTMLGGTVSSHAINISLYPKIGYDPIKSFAPVTLIGTNPVVLVVNAASPYKTLKDVLEASKTKPGGLSSASAGTRLSHRYRPLPSTTMVARSSSAHRNCMPAAVVAEVQRLRHQQRRQVPRQRAAGRSPGRLGIDQHRLVQARVSAWSPRM